MKKMSLAVCLMAASITVANAALLAKPARADVEEEKICSTAQIGYAQGYADASCGGVHEARLTSCSSTDSGVMSFSWTCL